MKSVLTTTAFISAALLLGRVSGFLREMLLARQYGTTESADAAVLMLTLPDFMVGLLLVGGFNAALVPALKKTAGPDRLALLNRVAVGVALLFALLTGLIMLFPSAIISVFAPSLDLYTLPNFKSAFTLSLIALPLTALIGVATSYLNTVGKFIIPSLSVLIFNGVLCIYLFAVPSGNASLKWFAVAILVATALRLGFQLGSMREAVAKPVWKLAQKHGDLFGKFIIGIFGYSIIIGAPIVFRSLYALNGDGFLARFNYAVKLFELPSALIIAPVVIVLLPKLAGMADKHPESFAAHVKSGLTASIALAGVATAVGLVFMPVIVSIIYQRGAISSSDAAEIAQLARILLLALPFYAIVQITAAALNAKGNPKAVMKNSGLALLLAVSFYFIGQNTIGGVYTSPAGFAVFYVASAGLNLASLWTAASLGKAFFKNTLVTIFKLSVGISPFILLQIYTAPHPVWIELLAMIMATLVLLGLIYSALKPLAAMRIDRQ